MTTHYYIDDSNFAIDYLNNGIQNFCLENYADDYSLNSVFAKISSHCIPSIIKVVGIKERSIGESVVVAFSNPAFIEMISPESAGIIDKNAEMAYTILKTNEFFVKNRIEKVASDLSNKSPDISDYLSIVVKMLANKKASFINYNYMEKQLRDKDNHDSFVNTYKEEEVRAKNIGLVNYKRAALLSTITKLGIDIDES